MASSACRRDVMGLASVLFGERAFAALSRRADLAGRRGPLWRSSPAAAASPKFYRRRLDFSRLTIGPRPSGQGLPIDTPQALVPANPPRLAWRATTKA